MSVEKFRTAMTYCVKNNFPVKKLWLRSTGFFNWHEIHSTVDCRIVEIPLPVP